MNETPGEARGLAKLYRADKWLLKIDFDALAGNGGFVDGPFRETFGDAYGDYYNPNRQAFGTLTDGRKVFCELASDFVEAAAAR